MVLAAASSWISIRTDVYAQSCYSIGALTAGRWKFTPVYVRNNSSAGSSAVSSARGDWNSLSQPFLVAAYGDFGTSQTDILIQDAAGNPNYTAQTTDSASGSCDGWEACSNCYHLSSVLTSSTISLNMTAIAQHAVDYTKSQSQVERTVVAHELGHALALADSSSNFQCGSGLSIMNPSIGPLLNCNMTGPQTCDATNLQNLYNGTGGPNSYCFGSCSFGSC